MSIERFKGFSKDAMIPVSFAMLMALVIGVWTLAGRIHQWEAKLERFEYRLGWRWSYLMEKASWDEAARLNPDLKKPDVSKIRLEWMEIDAAR